VREKIEKMKKYTKTIRKPTTYLKEKRIAVMMTKSGDWCGAMSKESLLHKS
jgi:hypothetical protein